MVAESYKNKDELIASIMQEQSDIAKIQKLFSYFLSNTKYNYEKAEFAETDLFGANHLTKRSDKAVITEIEQTIGQEFSQALRNRLNETIGSNFSGTEYRTRKIKGKIFPQIYQEHVDIENATFNQAWKKLWEETMEQESQVNIDGLLKLSFCEDFAEFARQILNACDIECHKVNGSIVPAGEQKQSPHAWNLIRINNKYSFCDFTRATTLASGHLPLQDVTPNDWIMPRMSRFCELRKGFSINNIDGKNCKISETNLGDIATVLAPTQEKEK